MECVRAELITVDLDCTLQVVEMLILVAGAEVNLPDLQQK